ncbi:FecCD family ABC transporter permease [Effusibacillus pohliae]|uniref:FecCD family ABC transporter permease n=1 Tax=Effusibacillus pohliae TaxID=232270 RepID=UPI000372FFFA|nr:iron ABC transporter permease [Effusibacillus pohliae]
MNTRKLLLGTGILSLFLIFSAGVGISVGSSHIPLSHSIGYILGHLPFAEPIITPNWSETEAAIIGKIRLPRVLLGILVGASLSLAGVAFQGVLRNPLADPYILGVSAGASAGAATIIALGAGAAVTGGLAWHGTGLDRLALTVAVLGRFAVPVAAFLGAMLALLLVFWLGRTERRLRPETLILSGVVVNSLFGAILTFALTMVADNKTQQIVLWLLGSLALRGWEHGLTVLPFFLLGFVVIWSCSRELNAFAMGEKGAASLGVHVERTKWILLLTASLVTAVAVSSAGIIGFVGLVIPHVVRMVTGSDHRVLIPLATLAGGIFLVLCDAIARSVVPPFELSIGVVTAAVGVPFFAWQLRRSRRGMW